MASGWEEVRRMPLPRIWRALKWIAAHPPADVLVRAYFGIKDPGAEASGQRGSLDDLAAFGRATGMGG